MSPAHRQIDESDRSNDLHQPLGDQLRDAFGLSLDHHADERLGAGGAHEDAALAAQELLLVRDGGLERIARHDGLLHAAVVADDDVQQHLRVLRAVGGEHGRALAGEREDLQELERGELTVAGGGVVGEDHVARLLAAELVAALHHLFDVLAGFLSTSLKGNPYLERAMLTGIQRVAKENIFSGLNNLTVLTVNDSEYEDCFGFTEEEVRKLLDDFDLELTDEVKEMYDGYRFGNKDIYNPWSAINYAVRKRLAPYWVNTAENSILKDALRERGTTFEKEYNKLIETGEITTVVSLTTAYYEHQSDASLWGLMVNAGMLTMKENLGDDYYTLRIPNQEVWSAFRELTAFSLQIDEEDMQKLFMELIRGNIDEFAKRYQNILLTLPSYHDLQCENSYHMMVLGMCVFQQKNYIIESNRENGNGRADLLMRAKRSGYPNMMLEFKYTKDKKEDLDKLAASAVEQMKDKKYDVNLDTPVYYIGLAHCGKQAVIHYQKS